MGRKSLKPLARKNIAYYIVDDFHQISGAVSKNMATRIKNRGVSFSPGSINTMRVHPVEAQLHG